MFVAYFNAEINLIRLCLSLPKRIHCVSKKTTLTKFIPCLRSFLKLFNFFKTLKLNSKHFMNEPSQNCFIFAYLKTKISFKFKLSRKKQKKIIALSLQITDCILKWGTFSNTYPAQLPTTFFLSSVNILKLLSSQFVFMFHTLIEISTKVFSFYPIAIAS